MLVRSFAFAARYTAQARVLVVAPPCSQGLDIILSSQPWVTWVAQGVRWRDAASWRAAIDAVAAMPSASVDRIIWLDDDAWTDPDDARRWIEACSRVLDRNGVLLVRKPHLQGLGDPAAHNDEFWRLADRLHAEFPWVHVSAEVAWDAMSVAPVQGDAQDQGALEVDARMVQDDAARCTAYWCLCALRKEDTEGWAHPTLMLNARGEQAAGQGVPRTDQLDLHSERCADAANLMTMRHRNAALKQRVATLGQQLHLWREQERPELLCKMVELQDRILWLRQQVVDLEALSVENVEAQALIQGQLDAALQQTQAQRQQIRELNARLEVMRSVAPVKPQAPERASAHEWQDSSQAALPEPTRAVAEHEWQNPGFSAKADTKDRGRERGMQGEAFLVGKKAESVGAEPVTGKGLQDGSQHRAHKSRAERREHSNPSTARGSAAEHGATGPVAPLHLERVEPSEVRIHAPLELERIDPEDARVFPAPEERERRGRGISRWTQKTRGLRTRLGEQAPEFMTRPLHTATPESAIHEAPQGDEAQPRAGKPLRRAQILLEARRKKMKFLP